MSAPAFHLTVDVPLDTAVSAMATIWLTAAVPAVVFASCPSVVEPLS